MTNFDQLKQLVGQLGVVSICSSDSILNHINMDIDTYDIYNNNIISICGLDGSEITVASTDIVCVDDNVVKLKNYLLVFETK